MKKIGATSSGTVIVEMTDAEFARLEKLPALSTGNEKCMTHDERVAFARERLRKLNTKTKEAAIHSIEAMFQFHGGITKEDAERIIASLRKEKFLIIDGQSRLSFPNPGLK
jgi:hypothetical protein